MNDYDHIKIEAKWKKKWFDDNIYEAVDFSEKPKKYILAELPYPSGKYLHVGHMMRYTVPEIYSRYLRMCGYNVMYPMGWDSFGLPTETFAIKDKKTPQEVTRDATNNFKIAMQDMGYAIDWNREINTSDPEYYKWTQWIFLKLFEKGLVEQKDLPVWWCKELGVLADEEVLSDPKSPSGKKSERDGYPVYRKNLKQWILKITNYADKLLEGLEDVDYFDSVKNGQRNWIGRKEGLCIRYPLENNPEIEIRCFTTRADTNYGATFIALAPEHDFAKKIAEENPDVNAYIVKSLEKPDIERIDEGKEKTGVFTGKYAINRLNNRVLPIWVSDFVLGDYGTGSVVGVPAHDKRDFAFASKYGIDIVRVVDNPAESTQHAILKIDDVFEDYGIAVNSEIINGKDSETALKAISEYLIEKGYAEKIKTYKLRDQIWSRQRYWGDPIPLMYTEDGKIVADYDLPVKLPILKDFLPEEGKAPLEKVPAWFNVKTKDGKKAKRETDTMPTWAGSNWYFMRYIDPKNNEAFADFEKLKYWMPVDKYFGDAGHTTAHLMYSRFWYKVLYEDGLVPTPEPFQWRMSGGLLLGGDRRKMSKSRPEFVVNPEDVLASYGADAARVYLSFIGPYEETYPWNENGIKACYRFINNVFQLSTKVSKEDDNKELVILLNKMIKNITKMLEDLKMNTAVSELMIYVNEAKKQKHLNKQNFLVFLKVLAPFAPFITEHLWQEFNEFKIWKKENSIHLHDWPLFDKTLVTDDTVRLPIQINGKLRHEIEVKVDTPEEEIKTLVFSESAVQKYATKETVKKFIYVKNKIVNLVV